MADDADRNAYRTTIDGGRNNRLLELQDAIAATSHQRFVHDSIANITERHAPDIDSLFARLHTLYPTDTYVLNLTSSEDLNATAGPEFDRYGMLSKPMAVLSYTLPGMPQIYTGQETGFARAFRAADKDLPPQWEPRVNEYFEFYRKLNRLKHTNHALATGADGGDMVRYATTDRDVYVFSRSADGHSVLVIVNLGPGDTYLKFTDEVPSLSSSAVNLFTDVHESLPSYLPPFAYYVYVSR
jgi:glycosidase